MVFFVPNKVRRLTLKGREQCRIGQDCYPLQVSHLILHAFQCANTILNISNCE